MNIKMNLLCLWNDFPFLTPTFHNPINFQTIKSSIHFFSNWMSHFTQKYVTLQKKNGLQISSGHFFSFGEYNKFLIEYHVAFGKYSSKIIFIVDFSFPKLYLPNFFALVSEWRIRALLPVVGTVYSHVSTALLICYPEKCMPNTPI